MSLPARTPLPAAETNPVPAHNEEKPSADVVESQMWHDIAQGYVDQAHENKGDLSVLFLDINALKAANDELGHEAGDRLIHTVAQLVPQSLRSKRSTPAGEREPDVVTSRPSRPKDLEDVVPGLELPEGQSARIGGDEFGVILPGTGLEGARTVANRLRQTFYQELAKSENKDLADVGAGVAIGVATLQPGMTASDLLRIADQAMYRDKLKQLRPLSDEERAAFDTAIEHLEKAGVRPRDVPNYLQMLGGSAVTQAFENQNDQADS